MYAIICADCGKEVMSVGANRKRCPECAEKRNADNVRKWGLENADRVLEMRRKRYKKYAKKIANEKKKKRKKPIMSWSEIIRVCEDNHISYGNAVAKGMVR